MTIGHLSCGGRHWEGQQCRHRAAGKSQWGPNLLCNLAEKPAFTIVLLVFRMTFLGASFQDFHLLFYLKVFPVCPRLSWLAGWCPEGGLNGHSASPHLAMLQFP